MLVEVDGGGRATRKGQAKRLTENKKLGLRSCVFKIGLNDTAGLRMILWMLWKVLLKQECEASAVEGQGFFFMYGFFGKATLWCA